MELFENKKVLISLDDGDDEIELPVKEAQKYKIGETVQLVLKKLN